MNQTSLNLLARDGSVAVVFRPALTPEQYYELYEIACDNESAEQLQAAVQQAAIRWGSTVTVDLPLMPNHEGHARQR